MGYELRRQLRELLGPDITGLARLVALEIADEVDDSTRTGQVALSDLAWWTGAANTAVVRDTLGRLAIAGWELRVPIGMGGDGRLLYAVPGRPLTFYVPERRHQLLVGPNGPLAFDAPGGRPSRRSDLVRLLARRDGPACRGCGYAPGDVLTLEVDHVMPRVLGGGNAMGNLQLLCRRCNQRKSSKHPDAWQAMIGDGGGG